MVKKTQNTDNKEELLKTVLSAAHGDSSTSQKEVRYTDLELAKMISKEFLDTKNVKSLANITKGQKQNIVNLSVLNTFYKAPAISKYCNEFLELSRSEDAIGIDAIIKIVTQNLQFEDAGNKKLWDKILRR